MDRSRSGLAFLCLMVLLLGGACVREIEKRPASDESRSTQALPQAPPLPSAADAPEPGTEEPGDGPELNPRSAASLFAAEDRGPGRPGVLPRDYELGGIDELGAADAEVLMELFGALGGKATALPERIIDPTWASHMARQALTFPGALKQIRLRRLKSPGGEFFARYRGLVGEELFLGTVRGSYGTNGGLKIEDIDIEARLSPPYPALIFPPEQK